MKVENKDYVFKQCFLNKDNSRLFVELEYVENERLHNIIASVRTDNPVNALTSLRKDYEVYDKVKADIDVSFDGFTTYVNVVGIKKV